MSKNKEKLFQYLKSQKLMSLATYGKEVAVCNVYYALDKDFNFYLITPPSTEHAQNIAKNKKVACAVVDSAQKVTDKKVGAQIKGNASKIRSLGKLVVALRMWGQVNPGMESIINIENIKKKIIRSTAYKIEPTSIKFFNEGLYGEKESELFKF
ncbi:pyridoxamine 5'-phosphate oxidase family protein [Patescibacteria group bacterium]|nr:pyridoxamine 5'-phosphate oxidase family protein [Patescibacteria group bacterium]